MSPRVLPAVLGALVTTSLTLTAPAAAAPPQKLTLGIKFDQPGLAQLQANRQPAGFDVDVATYIAKNLGVDKRNITWKEARSDRREDMIASGEVDFVVATYSITAKRKQKVTFAGPYFVTGQDLLVRNDTTDITRPEQLEGKTVCSAKGSTSAQTIQNDFATGVRLVIMDTYSACVDALLANQIDAVTTDDVILAGYAAQHHGKLHVVGHRFTRERYGVGLRKGNTALQRNITDAIKKMIKDGSWQRAFDRHIAPSGFPAPEPPPVFNSLDEPRPPAGPAEPALVDTANALITLSNAKQWETMDSMICASLKESVDKLVDQFTPEYDPVFGPELTEAGFVNTLSGLNQTTPDTAIFLAHEQFTNIPQKYKQYFKDIDYTGTMTKEDGTWKLCDLTADFQEG